MPVHQRQVIALIGSDDADCHGALTIIATCPKPCSKKWDKSFSDLLDSVRIRHSHMLSTPAVVDEPPAVLAEEDIQEESGATPGTHIFAMAIHNLMLHAYGDEEQACRRINALEVEDGMWAFFNNAGKPLQADFTEPNTGKIWRSEGKYRLRTPSLPTMPSFDAHIDRIVRVVGAHPLDSIAAVQLHLERQAATLAASLDIKL